MKVPRKNRIKFSIVTAAYLLWILWVGNWWLLLLVPVIFDIYISKKVHWAFWKKKGVKKQTKIVEWIDAIIFAVIAASFIRFFFFEAYTIPTSSMEKSMLVGDYLFVSKVAYGPRLPMTPLAVPFTSNTMPFSETAKSYSELIKMPYRRIAGLKKIERNDIIVFNFPAGDTVVLGRENPDYYDQIREYAYGIMAGRNNQNITYSQAESMARDMLRKNNRIIARPIDKRTYFIKRGVGMPGDTIQIIDSRLFVNGQPAENPDELQYLYTIKTNGTPLNRERLKEIGISYDEISMFSSSLYSIPLTKAMERKLKKFTNILSIEKNTDNTADPKHIFPFDKRYAWNADNFGPLYIPRKGTTVPLDTLNIPLYERIISVYENNRLEIKGKDIYINGNIADSYTFKMDYYWMMGDNRGLSSDSRFWGYVPEDHILGKASFIWLSLDKDKKFLGKIRWKRFFKKAE